MTRYYLDSCIWIDFYEDRVGIRGRPIGSYAGKFFMKLIEDSDELLFSDLTIKELRGVLGEEAAAQMLGIMSALNIVKKVPITDDECREAETLSKSKQVPGNDALHAVVARDNSAIIISQDNHFTELEDVVAVRKPEQVINPGRDL